jgi:hypothetical protein
VTSEIGQDDDRPAGPILFHAAMRLDDLVDQEGLPDPDLQAIGREIIDDLLQGAE